jgi:cob(I)alamin adenosyltransferase
MGKLYTRRGDEGQTDLLGGQRVRKDDPRIAACGCIDELSSVLGWVLAAAPPPEVRDLLPGVQRELFDIGAELSRSPLEPPPPAPGMTGEHVARLERAIDGACALLPALRNFILPGGCECAARLHVARAVCRRAERAVVTLAHEQAINRHTLAYLNRLNDLLFALARRCNQLAGMAETLWHG